MSKEYELIHNMEEITQDNFTANVLRLIDFDVYFNTIKNVDIPLREAGYSTLNEYYLERAVKLLGQTVEAINYLIEQTIATKDCYERIIVKYFKIEERNSFIASISCLGDDSVEAD